MTINTRGFSPQSRCSSDEEYDVAFTLSNFAPTDPSLVTNKNKIQKKKSKANKIKIPFHDIVRFLNVPQNIVAEKLGCSISTLKRRYYELQCGQRWPINSANSDTGKEFLESLKLSNEEKSKIKTILNQHEVESDFVDPLTMKVLQCAFVQNL
jgi:hypothetical protein